ncbi:MAG: MafB family polymorphic toxin [Neisseriaceae bacterium]|nr:MafB family polymorphic toxin [Neisseriaceae bacterium]
MKNPFKKLSGSLKKVLGISTLAAAVLLSPVANAELANDPFIRDGVTNRKNFEPGGKYHLFGSARGTVTNRGGQINIDTLNHLKVGNLDIEQGIIHGEITYHTNFSGQGHTWEVHSPFDEHASRSKSDKNDIIGVSSTAYSIEWTGDLKHPADGYDAPIGGGYPNPTGARDEYTYKVKGIADSVDIVLPEQPAFWQRMKNRWGNAKDIAVGGMTDAFEQGLTHNPNLSRAGNAAEVGNAVINGLGSAIGGGWELLGGNDAIEGAKATRDGIIMLGLNYSTPEAQLAEVNLLVQSKLGYDGLKESYARWEAENPNAAQFAGLTWNALENWVTKKGNTTGSYSNIEPYNRQKHYGGSQTNSSAAQAARQAGEGKPCPTCGQTQVSGTSTAPSPQHEPPLVKHYYEHGGSQMTPAQRKEYAKNEGINGTQCLTCQRKEGGKLSQYAKNKKKGNK